MALIRRLLETGGSPEIVARALTHGKHGLGSTVALARNVSYLDGAAREFREARRLSLGWDGSNHGGQEVVLGYATDMKTGLTVYLAPTATMGRGRCRQQSSLVVSPRGCFLSECFWILLDFSGFQEPAVPFSGFFWIPLDSSGFLWIPLCSSGFFWIPLKTEPKSEKI